MANPLIDQGTLNLLRGSAIFNDFPELNVTAPFLTPEGIGLGLEGEATTIIKTMTGTVTSPEPYMMVSVVLNLLRTQSLADAWKQQQEIDTRIGQCTIRPDSVTLSPYLLYNTAITAVGELTFNGKSAGYGVTLQGYWNINADLWAEAL